MSNTVYAQVVHLIGLAGLIVLTAMKVISPELGVGGIGMLLGIALPSPFGAAGFTVAASGEVSPSRPAPISQTPPQPPPASG